MRTRWLAAVGLALLGGAAVAQPPRGPPAPGTVRLRLPNPGVPGGTVPGPLLPVAGLSPGRFDAAFGLTVGRWFGESTSSGVEGSFFVRTSDTTFDSFAPGMVVLFPNGP